MPLYSFEGRSPVVHPDAFVAPTATLVGGMVMIVAYGLRAMDWRQAMFGTRWFVVFLPLTVFWGGVWLRRRHRPVSWALAGVLLTFSMVVSLIGATGPLPRDGFTSYTAAGAVRNLFHPPEAEDDRPASSVLAVVRDRPGEGS